MRRATIMLTAVSVMDFLDAGIALAKNISCARQDGGVCVGTNNSDFITGTKRADTIKARGSGEEVD